MKLKPALKGLQQQHLKHFHMNTNPQGTPANQMSRAQLGMREIVKKAAEDLVREVHEFIDHENSEMEYRGHKPGVNARTGRSDAGEIQGEYLSQFENRVQAIKEYLQKETGLATDQHTEMNVFRSMGSEIVAPGEVYNLIKQRIGWVAEHAERL